RKARISSTAAPLYAPRADSSPPRLPRAWSLPTAFGRAAGVKPARCAWRDPRGRPLLSPESAARSAPNLLSDPESYAVQTHPQSAAEDSPTRYGSAPTRFPVMPRESTLAAA